MKRMKLDLYVAPCAKIYSKQMKDLTVRVKSIKLLKVNTGKMLHDIEFSNDLFFWI
jgi:hypothetical protein